MMRMELMYSVDDVTDIKCSIPNPINASTDKIYAIIESMGIDNNFSDEQKEMWMERRNDLGVVCMPDWLYSISDDGIDNLSMNIITDLTIMGGTTLTHNTISMYLKFIREYSIKAFYFS